MSGRAVEALRARSAGPEEIAGGPGCLCARHPDEVGHSKPTGAAIERGLKLRGAGRNEKLAAMLGEA